MMMMMIMAMIVVMMVVMVLMIVMINDGGDNDSVYNDGKKQTVVVWVDLEKAFDRVWTKGLLLKLLKTNITHKMYNWIKQYIHNRKAKVCLKGKYPVQQNSFIQTRCPPRRSPFTKPFPNISE